MSLLITRTLLIVPVLAALIAPRAAEACSPPPAFLIERTWPVTAAEAVPTDGAILLIGFQALESVVTVEVTAGDQAIAGTVTALDDERYVWRADAPLAPDTEHQVHVVTHADFDPSLIGSEIDLTFKTGPDPAPPLAAGAVASAVVEAWDKELQECLDEPNDGDCGSLCEEWESLGIEHRIRLALSADAPAGPFDGGYVAHLAVAPTLEALATAGASRQIQHAGQDFAWALDLGLAGSWPGDQVCYQVEFEDPLGARVKGEAACADASEVNVEPPPESTTGEEPETTGEEPEVTTGSEPETGGEPETDGEVPGGDDAGHEGDKAEGCSCRSDASGDATGLLALLGLAFLRPRRRR